MLYFPTILLSSCYLLPVLELEHQNDDDNDGNHRASDDADDYRSVLCGLGGRVRGSVGPPGGVDGIVRRG